MSNYILSEDSLKPFNDKEKELGEYCIALIIHDKTDQYNAYYSDRMKEIRDVENDVYLLFLGEDGNERSIDISHILYRAIKELRENPDLHFEALIVSKDSFGYDPRTGKMSGWEDYEKGYKGLEELKALKKQKESNGNKLHPTT